MSEETKLAEGWYTIMPLRGSGNVECQHRRLEGKRVYVTKEMQGERSEPCLQCWGQNSKNKHIPKEGNCWIFYTRGLRKLLKTYKYEGKEYC